MRLLLASLGLGARCGSRGTWSGWNRGDLMRERRWSRWVVLLAVLAAGCVAARSPVATEAEFRRWSSEAPARAEAFARFEAMLSAAGVGGVVPAYDLWIADRLKPKCLVEPFVAPPDKDWPNIVPALRFIRDHVKPAIGDVRVVSAYRDPAFNACVGGAPASAHKEFHAVDLLPVDRAVTRDRLISTLCAIHQREGARAGIGLGIYGGRRFHLDARSYRGWGADRRSASFPCRANGVPGPIRRSRNR
jgi:Peptidase M15